MPGTVSPYFTALLLQQLAGQNAAASTLYLGLRTASGTEIAGGGYARVALPTSSLVPGGGNASGFTLISNAKFPLFTGVPSPNGATHWFLTDSPTGAGNEYASGPLNPAPIGGQMLGAAAAAGETALQVRSGAAYTQTNDPFILTLYDYLALGSVCGGDFELAQIVQIAPADPAHPTQTLTLAAPLRYAHPLRSIFTRDGATRYYTAGFPEIVSAGVTFTPVPAQ